MTKNDLKLEWENNKTRDEIFELQLKNSQIPQDPKDPNPKIASLQAENLKLNELIKSLNFHLDTKNNLNSFLTN